MTEPQHLENPDPAGAFLGIAIGAVVIFGIVWALKSENELTAPSAPTKPACPTYDDLAAFSSAKGYHVWYVEAQPVATWKEPNAEFAADPQARAWGATECSFFRWQTGHWIPDAQTNQELLAFASGAVSSPRLTHAHPIAALMPPLG